MTKVQLGNSNNWNLLHSGNQTAMILPGGNNSHLPIESISIPISLESTTIAVFIQTEDPKSTWKYGGSVGANIVTGLIVGGNSNSEIARRACYLDKINIIYFPSVSNSYSLVLYPPKWFKNIEWIIWEYIGEGNIDPQGKLDEIYNLISL
jgi:hypothetical protein